MKHIQEYTQPHAQHITKLFEMIFRKFNKTILMTHRSKYVQFLIFYTCGLEDKKANESNLVSQLDVDNRIYRQFAAQLINNLLSSDFSPVERQSSVCYLASFIARSSFISPCTICESIAALLRWAETYIDTFYDVSMDVNTKHSGGKAGIQRELWKRKVETHAVFYNVCQAAFYIMCFRGKEAVEYYEKEVASQISDIGNSENDVDLASIDIHAKRWEKMCKHEHLQPLKYCLESVRREFLFIARVFHLLPKTLIQALEEEDEKMATLIADRQARLQNSSNRKKKRQSISTPATKEKHRLRNAQLKKKGEKIGGGVGGLGKGSNPLDSFFPFDPCLLRLSHGFIEPFYIDWDGGAQIENESAISDEEMSEDDDESMSFESSSSSEGEAELDDCHDTEPMSFSSIGAKMDIEIKNMKRARAQSIGSGSW